MTTTRARIATALTAIALVGVIVTSGPLKRPDTRIADAGGRPAVCVMPLSGLAKSVGCAGPSVLR